MARGSGRTYTNARDGWVVRGDGARYAYFLLTVLQST